MDINSQETGRRVYIRVCVYVHRTHTYNVAFQPEFTPKQTSFLVSVYQWVDFLMRLLTGVASLFSERVQSPTRPCANGPLPASLASSAATAFLSHPRISLTVFSVPQMCQGYVAVTSRGMSFHRHHTGLAPPCH